MTAIAPESNLSLSGMRIAVIGATGFIGSHLLERLVEEGAHVLAMARSEIRRENLESASGRYEFAACDIVTSPDLNDIFSRFRPTVVYLLAARPDAAETFDQMEAALKVNSLGTLRVLEAAAGSGVARLVYGGSSKIFGNHTVPSRLETPSNPVGSYAISKSAGWQMCKLYSLLHPMETVCLHPAFVYGPRQNWNLIRYVQQCVDRGEPVRLQGGSQTRDPLYIADAVQAYVHAGFFPDLNGKAIPIGGGTELRVADLAQEILNVLGSPRTKIEIGSAEPRPTEVWRNFVDNASARELLGWAPSVDLNFGLRLTFGLNETRMRSTPYATAETAL